MQLQAIEPNLIFKGPIDSYFMINEKIIYKIYSSIPKFFDNKQKN